MALTREREKQGSGFTTCNVEAISPPRVQHAIRIDKCFTLPRKGELEGGDVIVTVPAVVVVDAGEIL